MKLDKTFSGGSPGWTLANRNFSLVRSGMEGKKLAANKRGSVSMKNNGKCKTRESGEEISGGEDELSRNGWAGPEKEICY